MLIAGALVASIYFDANAPPENVRIDAADNACLEHKFTHSADAVARVAHVGRYVRQAHDQDLQVETFTIPMHDVTRAIETDDSRSGVALDVRAASDGTINITKSDLTHRF